MREILFRGKSIIDNEWVYGDYWDCTSFIRIIDDVADSEPVIRETVGQYTGLKDKNGVKIFEGDVLKFERQSGVWINQLIPQLVKYPFICGNTHLGEIIGNIHDNPELLEVQDE